MKQLDSPPAVNSWIAVDANIPVNFRLASFVLVLEGNLTKFQAIKSGDWVLIANKENQISRVARILRVRSDLSYTTLYFDKVHLVGSGIAVNETTFAIPKNSNIRQILLDGFVKGVDKTLQLKLEDIPTLTNQVYIRELLQLSVMDDLLGPAGGPNELIVDMSVRDRYLVGKLAPIESAQSKGKLPIDANDDDQDVDLNELVIIEPDKDLDSPAPKSSGNSDDGGELDISDNQSLIPSSFGLTFCVDGLVNQIEVEARWGCYERLNGEDHDKVKKNGQKAKVWRRIPSGGTLALLLKDGLIEAQVPDGRNPHVFIQGSVREKNINGDRLVTLFLVNSQIEPKSNGETAWLFQPELIVRSTADQLNKSIFRRKPLLEIDSGDSERQALEMLYRNRVEFAVGHGVSIHATVAEDSNFATEVRTAVIPSYEVQATETPGANDSDRPAMKSMLTSGLLDMKKLASLDVATLCNALNVLTDDYAQWIDEQDQRIGSDVRGYDYQAQTATDKCKKILVRLREGIKTLNDDPKALKAFRFANQAMALQRIHSQFALEVRRGKDVDIEKYNNDPKYSSWRPFQLAFLLLSIPSLANPKHADRADAHDANADLLWFPTGGGKTEAYLGVAAFAMSIRRLQGNFDGFDGSRGLTVIMRYTLRLLTLQQFQRGTALICAMETLRRKALATEDLSLGLEPFTIGLWVGNNVTPGTTDASHDAIEALRNPGRNNAGLPSPVQLTSCPWCGSSINPGIHAKVETAKHGSGRTYIMCGDPIKKCEFSTGTGIPVLTVDEEIYHHPPTMMIATVDKFAMMARRGQIRTLFGKVSKECTRHGLLWPDCDCNTGHKATSKLAAATVKTVSPIRPPDLIIQDEFHLISGPLGTMVGLYESAIDELCSWKIDGINIKPKIIASTATVRKAEPQINNVFSRNVSIFPPHGLDIEDNYFSVQRPLESQYGRRYFGVCSPGSSRPAVLIRVYTAFLTASQQLFDHFGEPADPYMTIVGYFNSLRELGGMKRLAEDDVRTRSFKVNMSMVDRPGLDQRKVNNIRELTSRVSSQDIPKYLDELEVKFKSEFDTALGKYVTKWEDRETRAIDLVLATNMLSVGVDINRLGLMAVNGQPKGTAEYIQATSRVGRSFPGLVCTVLTWSRPRDLSHYETYEHYHATFYKHVEAQSVTPFSPRALDRGLTGTMLSLIRLKNEVFSPNEGAGMLHASNQAEMTDAIDILTSRAWDVSGLRATKDLSEQGLKRRSDDWAAKAKMGGRTLAYEKSGVRASLVASLVQSPGENEWNNWTVPMSMREVEPGVRLIMNKGLLSDPAWIPPIVKKTKD